MFAQMGTFASVTLLLCICSARMLQATPIDDGMRNSREAKSYFPFALPVPDHVHYYPEHHHHHHFDAHSVFPSHHDTHFHLDTGLDHHHHHHHHDFHDVHYDQHYY
ncbi:histidine-rich glycoprotein-like [Anopheles ziemanni]|uniref:histidine-rich glycoprotein-like n=1 Tax=Anopheles coustani TaxID=139045 RepID=UPI00265AF86C|nr:histidine-rich glycoprotein-like [Anopheles coustani]XP_058166433.1 histidine-rich glycoprotein-like [Anopheles ziemanni]